VAAAHVRAEIFQVLTDDQKTQIQQIISRRDSRSGPGRNKGN
jgi:hypothetical protein